MNGEKPFLGPVKKTKIRGGSLVYTRFLLYCGGGEEGRKASRETHRHFFPAVQNWVLLYMRMMKKNVLQSLEGTEDMGKYKHFD